MVSFSCEVCNDTVAKKKLDQHRAQCRGATFTCLDCMVHFPGTDYRSHTSCISEAQKYQGHLYRQKDGTKGQPAKRTSADTDGHGHSQAMVPHQAYVEDAPDGWDESQAVAVIDVPPRAPTPPTVAALPETVNVFDFLVNDGSLESQQPALDPPEKRKMIDSPTPLAVGDSQHSERSTAFDSGYVQNGFTYGYSPIHAGLDRYDSWNNFTDSQASQTLMPPPPYVTPAPKEHRKEKKEKRTTEKSDKKRKRQVLEELDLSSTKRPVSRDEPMSDAPATAHNGKVLHSGLTGGLNKLITDSDFYDDRIAAGPTPISPIKRSKRGEDVADPKKDRRKSSYTSYSTTTTTTTNRKPSSTLHHSRSRSHDRSSSLRDDRSHRRHHRRASASSDDHATSRRLKAIEFHPDRPASVQPHASNQMISYRSRADLFLSYIKGPDSEYGCSINKVLKRYHRERDVRGDSRDEDDKELWKSLRLRKNDRGEIVLFVGDGF